MVQEPVLAGWFWKKSEELEGDPPPFLGCQVAHEATEGTYAGRKVSL